jgi:hypothetical protein
MKTVAEKANAAMEAEDLPADNGARTPECTSHASITTLIEASNFDFQFMSFFRRPGITSRELTT